VSVFIYEMPVSLVTICVMLIDVALIKGHPSPVKQWDSNFPAGPLSGIRNLVYMKITRRTPFVHYG